MKAKTFAAIREYVNAVTEVIPAVRNYGEEASVKRLLAASQRLLHAISEEDCEENQKVDNRPTPANEVS